MADGSNRLPQPPAPVSAASREIGAGRGRHPAALPDRAAAVCDLFGSERKGGGEVGSRALWGVAVSLAQLARPRRRHHAAEVSGGGQLTLCAQLMKRCAINPLRVSIRAYPLEGMFSGAAPQNIFVRGDDGETKRRYWQPSCYRDGATIVRRVIGLNNHSGAAASIFGIQHMNSIGAYFKFSSNAAPCSDARLKQNTAVLDRKGECEW